MYFILFYENNTYVHLKFERNVTHMKELKMIFAVMLCALALCSCGGNKTTPTPSPEPTTAVTDAPQKTDNADGGSVMDDIGDMAEDAGNAVGDAAKDVGDAVNDVVGNNDNK